MVIDIFLLQASSNPLIQYGPLIVIMLLMWFFFIRPQAKKQKEQANFLNEIAKGDDVVTAGGIHGKINKIDGNIVTLQVDQKSFIKVNKSVVSKEMTDTLASDA